MFPHNHSPENGLGLQEQALQQSQAVVVLLLSLFPWFLVQVSSAIC